MKHTIITVCKNAGQEIERTIQSVISQTFKSIEYIIIDGASSDNTKRYLERYKNNINICISEPDDGIYQAMNKGIKLATGKTISFLNAGDELYSCDIIENVSKVFTRSNVEVLYGDYIYKDANNESLKYSLKHIISKNELYHFRFAHPSTYYKSSVFKKVGIFNEQNKVVSDLEWNIKALTKAKIGFTYLEMPLSVFYYGGISTDIQKKELVQHEVDSVFSEYFSKFELKLIKSKVFRRFYKIRVVRYILIKILNWELNKKHH